MEFFEHEVGEDRVLLNEFLVATVGGGTERRALWLRIGFAHESRGAVEESLAEPCGRYGSKRMQSFSTGGKCARNSRPSESPCTVF